MLRKGMVIVSILLVISLLLVGCGSTSKPAASSTPSSSSTASNAPAAKAWAPTRTIEIVNPYSAGSGVELNIRALVPSLERALKGTIVVNSKPGASSAIGTNYVAKSKPDGYTLGLANIGSVLLAAMTSDAGFDGVKDLKWIGGTVADIFLIAAPADSPYNSVKDVVDYLKAHPKGLRYGASGTVSTDAMLALNIEQLGGVEFNKVIFNGGGESMAALLGGHVDLYGGAQTDVWSLYQAGKLKILGVGGDQRSTDLPNVPTFKEQGFDMTFNMAKRAVFAPANIDPAALATLQAAVKTAVEDPDFAAKAQPIGLKPKYFSPEECQQEVERVSKWILANKDKIKQ